MVTPWQIPLPLEEYTAKRVLVYFYSSKWIPITFSRLLDAIALHHKAKIEGREIYVFPSDINPCDFAQCVVESYSDKQLLEC